MVTSSFATLPTPVEVVIWPNRGWRRPLLTVSFMLTPVDGPATSNWCTVPWL